MGFLEVEFTDVVRAFIEWQMPLQEERGGGLAQRSVKGSLQNALKSLLPLTDTDRRRYLFVPTVSQWVAFFDNGRRGTDAFSVVSYLAKTMGCRGLRVVAVPDTVLAT